MKNAVTPPTGVQPIPGEITAVTSSVAQAGLSRVLGASTYNAILHIGCCDEQIFEAVRARTIKMYFGFCSDIRTLDKFRQRETNEGSGQTPSVRFFVRDKYTVTGTPRLLDLIFCEGLSAFSFKSEGAARACLEGFLRSAKKVVIQVILAEEIGHTTGVDIASAVGVCLDELEHTTRFFPLSFYEEVAREARTLLKGKTVTVRVIQGESVVYESVSFSTHYLVFETA